MLTTTRKPSNEVEALDSPAAGRAVESPQAAHPDHSPAVAKSVKSTHTGNAMLTITRKPPTENEPLIATLEGNIDAHAAESLRELYDLPPPSARLDFTGVQRVNSMGLALLLKLFEHCENKGVGIHVVNANRMTSMLFKMTNLDRYLGEGGKAGAASPAQKTTRTIQKQVAPAAEVHAPAEPAADRTARAPSVRPATAQPVALNRAEQAAPPASVGVQGKLVFLANMQNSQQLNGWYFFNTYLQRRLGRDIHLDLVHAAWDNELQPSATHLVFAQPFQATRLLLKHGFHLVARPTEQADEITVLVRADDTRRSLTDFAGGKAVTDTAESFVYLLGRFLLDEGGLASESLEYMFTGHEIKAVRTLLNGDADLLFLPTENYNSLSALTRSRLRPLDASDSGLAFHLFCLSPACADLLPGLRETLLEMTTAEKGKQVLDDLGLTSWSEPEREEIDMLTMLYQRYVG